MVTTIMQMYPMPWRLELIAALLFIFFGSMMLKGSVTIDDSNAYTTASVVSTLVVLLGYFGVILGILIPVAHALQ